MALIRHFYRSICCKVLSRFSSSTYRSSISKNFRHKFSTLVWSEIQPYNAIRIVLDEKERIENMEFYDKLKLQVSEWRKEGRSAVWLHIPVKHSALVSQAVVSGFTLHHAFNNEIVLYKWLDDTRQNKIPHFASHQVGVCGVVIREDTSELLVTQDKYKPAKWKFPGGLSEFAENIADTAEREVLEETGIVAEFQSVLAFRQHHHLPMAFDQSDLYFVCRMKPLSHDIIPCPEEVLKCQWFPIKELQLSPYATLLTNRIAGMVLQGLKKGFSEFDINCEEWPSLLPGHTYHLFLRTDNEDGDVF